MVLSWKDYFMGLAKLSALRSKDPKTQVGCCIVDPNTNRIVSMGYNGLPRNCNDEDFNWGKNPDENGCTKYEYVVHAELNAIINAKTDLTGYHLYVTHSPCCDCMKAIIQSGIKKVYYNIPYDDGSPSSKATILMCKKSGVELIPYKYDEGLEIQLQL